MSTDLQNYKMFKTQCDFLHPNGKLNFACYGEGAPINLLGKEPTEETFKLLKDYNDEGYDIYVVVQEAVGFKDNDVTGIRTFIADWDAGYKDTGEVDDKGNPVMAYYPEDEVKVLKDSKWLEMKQWVKDGKMLKPTWVTDTRNGMHIGWVSSELNSISWDGSLEEDFDNSDKHTAMNIYRATILSIAKHLGTDEGIFNPGRVFRVVGLDWKKTHTGLPSVLTTIKFYNKTIIYTPEEIMNAYPLDDECKAMAMDKKRIASSKSRSNRGGSGGSVSTGTWFIVHNNGSKSPDGKSYIEVTTKPEGNQEHAGCPIGNDPDQHDIVVRDGNWAFCNADGCKCGCYATQNKDDLYEVKSDKMWDEINSAETFDTLSSDNLEHIQSWLSHKQDSRTPEDWFGNRGDDDGLSIWLKSNDEDPDDTKLDCGKKGKKNTKKNYSSAPPVYRKEGRYLAKRSNYDVLVSNFTFKLIALVKTDEQGFVEWHNKIELTCKESPESPVIKMISPRAFSGAKQWNKEMGQNPWFIFTGSDKDLLNMQHLECSGRKTYIKGFTRDGIVITKGKIYYIEGEKSIDKNGLPTNKVCNVNRNIKKTRHILQQDEITKEELEQLLEHLFKYNESSVTYPLNSWMFYCFIKEQMREFNKDINVLCSVYGIRGTAKTQTIRMFIEGLFSCTTTSEQAGSAREFAIIKTLNESSMIPVHVDEFKNLSKFLKDLWGRILRGLYNHGAALRGTKDLNTVNHIFYSPAIISGEISIDEPAVRQRIVDISLSDQGRNYGTQHFEAIDRKMLGKLGKSILLHSLSLSQEWLEKAYETLLKKFKDDVKWDSRLQENAASTLVGLFVFTDMLRSKGIDEQIYKQIMITGYDEMRKSFEALSGADSNNALDNTMEILDQLIQDGKMTLGKHYTITEDRKYLNLHLDRFYMIYSKHFKDYENTGYDFLDKKSLRVYLSKADYYTGKDNCFVQVTPDSYQDTSLTDDEIKALPPGEFVKRRAWQLDLEKLQMATKCGFTYKKDAQDFYKEKKADEKSDMSQDDVDNILGD